MNRHLRHRLIEQMERRQLLSSVVDGILRINGTAGNDQIEVSSSGDQIVVEMNNDSESFDSADVQTLDIRAGAGDDRVLIHDNVTKDTRLNGQDGDDTLVGGGGDDTLIAGSGDDALSGGGDFDTPAGVNIVDYSSRTEDLNITSFKLTTEAGETDTFGANVQKLISGRGNDKIVTSYDPTGFFYIDAGAGNDDVRMYDSSFAQNPTVHGGDGNDDLLIYARGRTGFYFGDDGNDIMRVYRSSQTDRDFHGGAGSDTVTYGAFSNEFFPVNVSFDDVANDGSRTDQFPTGGDPHDNVRTDVEVLFGTPGPDTIAGSDGAETLDGDGGNDSISGNGGDDSINGSAGDDQLIAGAGHDTVVGGDGTDTITADADDEVIDAAGATLNLDHLDVSGSSGNDVIELKLKSGDANTLQVVVNGQTSEFDKTKIQNTRISAGDGDDVVTFGAGTSFNPMVFGGNGDDSITGTDGDFENLAGGAGNDTIVGGNGYNVLSGDDGNDHITSGNGDDQIDAGAGNDTVNGGAGDDGISGRDGNDSLNGGTGVDSISGGNGNDTLVADSINDSLDGGPGTDELQRNFAPPPSSGTTVQSRVDNGQLKILGTDGNNNIVVRVNSTDESRIQVVVDGVIRNYDRQPIRYIVVDGRAGNDAITIDDSIQINTKLYGGAGNDRIYGGSGADRIDGGAGNDKIFGGEGNDLLEGSSGTDVLRGDEGRDRIIASRGSDDFKKNRGDILKLSA